MGVRIVVTEATNVQADPLAALEAEAAALDAAAVPAPPAAVVQAEAQRAEDTVAALLEVLQFARSMAAPAMSWWADFGAVYSDEALHKIAAAGAVVMDRHGWTLGEMFEQWGPYVALAAAVAPPALATVHAFKARAIAQHQARQRPQQPQQQGGAHGSDQPATH